MRLNYNDLKLISESAYRHGQSYAKGQIYRSTGRYVFKNPHVLGLPHWVISLDLDAHKICENLYKKYFRKGLRGVK